MSTPESNRSSYVRAEIAKAREVKRLAPELVLMDPRDFLRSAAGSVVQAVGSGMQGEPAFKVRGLAYEPVPCDPAKPDCRR